MKHIMFDIDGTLIQSYDFDEKCFMDAVHEVTGIAIKNDWEAYPHVTDRGILQTFIERQAPQYSLEELENRVKPVFIRNIEQTIKESPAVEVKGAKRFLMHVLKNNDYIVSVATGGWRETARLKLQSAGFDTDNLIIASSNDHHARIEIMAIAQAEADPSKGLPITYFGDAIWDVKACAASGVNLVIVGERVDHNQRILDYSSLEQSLSFVK
ncbi:HAD family hydrolase [Grimontia sp. NTOU-MAR1]|uniref:HAD family hydrolase n=1 Tax=Grimontia sp. NTOU-MAR1 TaxID=3111011 RepID=UPI002DB659B8|nr:HAD family hydrolase [Grimontia sp. NTOU-MAR1]WRW00125.1 HAD family hydrolase [Grimontia sp. NTOU-MAR1]